MPLQSSGAISLVNIQTEFGGSNPIGLSEYYRGGTYVLSGAGNNINIPTSGTISLYNFYGTQAANFGSLSASVSSVAEGNSVTFTLVGGTGIPNGTYPWRVQGTNITALDISGGTGWNTGTLTGLFTITSNTGSFNVTTASDYSIEGTESIVALVGNVGDTNVVTPYITSGSVSITDGATFAASATNASLYRIGSASYRTTTINVTSTYTLQLGTTTWYWDVNGLDTGDIPATSGLFTMLAGTNPNSSGLFSIVATPVYLGEPSDKLFTVRIYTDASRTQLVATTPSLTLRAHGTISSVSWSPTSVNEGLSFSYTINTTNMPPNDLLGLYFNTVAILGTITTTDFLASGGALNGVLAGSTNGSGQIVGVLPTYMDTELEGVETFRLDFRAPDNATILHTGQTLTIAAPTYNVTTNLTLVNEGSGVVITVYTTGVPVNTTLYWTATAVSGTINLGDLSSLTGSASVIESLGQYAAAFLILVTADSFTEGTESFKVNVYRDVAKTILVGSSPTITINDTSLSLPTYNSITPSTTLVNEGSSVTFTVNTSNVPNGTTLYWSTNGAMSTLDFTDFQLAGSFTITSNSGTITRTLVNDFLLGEGNELFSISVRTGSTSGTVQLTSSSITVVDTSAAPTYLIVVADPPSRLVNEQSNAFRLDITTTNVLNGTVLYISPSNSVLDYSTALTNGGWLVTISNNAALIVLTTYPDTLTEGTETVNFTLRSGSPFGTQLAVTPQSLTILDLLLTPPSYSDVSISVQGSGPRFMRMTVSSNNMNGSTLNVTGVCLWILGNTTDQNNPGFALYPAGNINFSGTTNSFYGDSVLWPNYATQVTFKYVISMSGAYTQSNIVRLVTTYI